MRLSQRLIAAAVLLSLSGALAGCGSVGNWDPTDLLDFLDTKKKLPGDRKPVFPEGVPGLEQGVPKELYKGSAQEQLDQQNAQAVPAAAPPPPEEPKSRQGGKKGKKAKPAAAASAERDAAQPAAEADPNASVEGEGAATAVPPEPKPKKIVRRRTTAPPPDAQPAGQQQSAAPFPAPLPSNNFQR